MRWFEGVRSCVCVCLGWGGCTARYNFPCRSQNLFGCSQVFWTCICLQETEQMSGHFGLGTIFEVMWHDFSHQVNDLCDLNLMPQPCARKCLQMCITSWLQGYCWANLFILMRFTSLPFAQHLFLLILRHFGFAFIVRWCVEHVIYLQLNGIPEEKFKHLKETV